MRFGSLFAGIGGLDLGLERAGMTCAWQCEIDPFCGAVLKKHWPDVPLHRDIRELDLEHLERVDLICGGFPCQPVSDAGSKLGAADERWLWPDMHGVLDALRPDWVLIENVSGLRTRGLDAVRLGLRGLGYVSRPLRFTACELGAPHTRARLFVVAHSRSYRCNEGRPEDPAPASSTGGREPAERGGWWADEPAVDRVAHGFPGRVDRARAIGNAVVPQVAEAIGRRIAAASSVA